MFEYLKETVWKKQEGEKKGKFKKRQVKCSVLSPIRLPWKIKIRKIDEGWMGM